jgi:hypothetical protein
VKRLRWDGPERPVPKRPYRDTALVYAGMAGLVVVVGLVTGGGIVRTLVIAAAFFVVATGWSWRNWRNRLRRREERRR